MVFFTGSVVEVVFHPVVEVLNAFVFEFFEGWGFKCACEFEDKGFVVFHFLSNQDINNIDPIGILSGMQMAFQRLF